MDIHVLIVDDDERDRKRLEEAITSYAALRALSAANGKEAVQLLRTCPISLVVTDLQMPEMDGFELMAYLSSHHPKMPIIVMTAHGTPEIEARLQKDSTLNYLEKPLDGEELAASVFDMLNGAEKGFLQGISVVSFLQLLEMDRKTCTLKVESVESTGFLYLLYGRLIGAEVGSLKGDQAVYTIISWEDGVSIEIENVCRAKKRTVTSDLTHLIMESLRLKDEQTDPSMAKTLRSGSAEFSIVEEAMESDRELDLKECLAHIEAHSQTSIVTPLPRGTSTALVNQLHELREIRGYQGAMILTPRGEIVASDDLGSGPWPGGSSINQVILCIHGWCKEIGLQGANEIVLSEPRHVFLLRCSGADSPAHIHFAVMMDVDCGEGLMRIRMRRMIPTMITLLSKDDH